MSKIIQKLIVILLLAIIFISNAINIIQAVYSIPDAYIEKVGDADYHLEYYNSEKGMYTYSTCSIVGHYQNGEFYPAYCLNRDLQGVGKVENYTVDVDSYINNDQVWRAVKNGFPYKKANEMGLSSDFDAYVVTKFAVYCLIGQADVNVYKAKDGDTEGQAMLTALNNLVDIGKNNSEAFNNKLEIIKEGDLVEEENYYSITYRVTSNEKFSEYNITSVTGLSNGDILTDINGNQKTTFSQGEKFKIKISKSNLNSNKDINIEAQAKIESFPMYHGKTRIEGTQDYLLTSNSYEDIKAKQNLKLQLDTGKLKIIKKDDETQKPIEGVTFELYNSNGEKITTATTNTNGEIEFNNLFEGNYTLKETKTNENYILNEDTKFDIHITFNKETTLEIENEHKKGNLTIYKVDKDNNHIALGNVGFELYSEETGSLIGTYYTDADGKIEIKNLRTGNYLLKEINTNQWYNLAEDTQIEVKWNETTNTTVEDELKKSQIKVIKVDKDNNQIKIPNVVFEVLDVNNNLLETIKTNEQGEAYTNKYSIRDFQKLRLHEIKTDTWYKLNDNITEVTLQENDIKTVVFENEKKKGQIKVIKVDLDNNEIKLKGVKFNVLDEEGIVVDTIVTDEEGVALTKKLPIDKKYTIQEIETNENYVLSQETKTIELEEDKITDIIFENEKKKGQIRVIKVDSENNEIKLEGVEFNVLDEEGNIIEKLKTDKEGVAITSRLPIDKNYVLKETKTNEKYVLSSEAKTITLKENEISDIIFENEKIKGKIKIIKTTSENSDYSGIEKDAPLEGVEFEVYDENNNKVDTITTNEEGIAITKDLEKGKYRVKETKTNEWYLLDKNDYILEIEENNQLLTLNVKNTPGIPNEEVEKTGRDSAIADEEIEYKIKVKNTGNVPLDNFIWEDEIPVDYIRVTKMDLGTYNQEKNYDLYYKTNFSEDYILLLEDINTTKNEKIDFSKELSDNEYITNIKLDFGTVETNFMTEQETSIYATVNSNVKKDDIFENKVTLTGNYKGYNITKDSKWKTKINKILPITGI